MKYNTQCSDRKAATRASPSTVKFPLSKPGRYLTTSNFTIITDSKVVRPTPKRWLPINFEFDPSVCSLKGDILENYLNGCRNQMQGVYDDNVENITMKAPQAMKNHSSTSTFSITSSIKYNAASTPKQHSMNIAKTEELLTPFANDTVNGFRNHTQDLYDDNVQNITMKAPQAMKNNSSTSTFPITSSIKYNAASTPKRSLPEKTHLTPKRPSIEEPLTPFANDTVRKYFTDELLKSPPSTYYQSPLQCLSYIASAMASFNDGTSEFSANVLKTPSHSDLKSKVVETCAQSDTKTQDFLKSATIIPVATPDHQLKTSDTPDRTLSILKSDFILTPPGSMFKSKAPLPDIASMMEAFKESPINTSEVMKLPAIDSPPFQSKPFTPQIKIVTPSNRMEKTSAERINPKSSIRLGACFLHPRKESFGRC